MNKKGFTLILSLMVAVVLFILGMALAPGMKDTVSTAMNSTQLNCSTTTDQQARAACTQLDAFQPLLIGIIFGLAGFVLTGIAT